jgi:hypothetical protein
MKILPRSALAFVTAAIAPPAVILLPYAADLALNATSRDQYAWTRFSSLTTLMIVSTLPHVALAIPAFLILYWRRAVRWWSTVLAGFVLGCLPIAIGNWPVRDDYGHSTSSHWNGEKMVHTMIDGVPTLDGWIQYLKILVVFGGFGAVGGLAFWIVWRALQPRDPTRQSVPAIRSEQLHAFRRPQ